MPEIYFEDVETETTVELGSYRIPREEMLAFAERYDPQPFHVDEAAAGDSIYGELIASGWYTASVCMRLLVDGFLEETASMGSFGLEELRWEAPVRAGDVLTAEVTFADKRPSSSRDDRGYVTNEVVATNRDDETVLRWTATNIFERRE